VGYAFLAPTFLPNSRFETAAMGPILTGQRRGFKKVPQGLRACVLGACEQDCLGSENRHSGRGRLVRQSAAVDAPLRTASSWQPDAG